MLKINNNRNKSIVTVSIGFFVLLVILYISVVYYPEIYKNVLCRVSAYSLGILVLYSYYKLLFRWKIISLSSDSIEEEYYSIFKKDPYKVKRIVSWQKVRCVHLIKYRRMGKPQPCHVRVKYLNDKGQLDYYTIHTDGLYFMNYKGQEYDSRLVDCLNEICKTHSFKIEYE